jgi:TolB-like protein/class 3 adenylate cyclase
MNSGQRQRVERRLAAILAADIAGYSRLMGEDEEGTLARVKAIRRELSDPKIKEHRGRIVKTTGDGLLVEFASVVDAVRCAVEVQREMALRNAVIPQAQRIELRIGINLGDIIKDGRDIYGDGVNVAARLEALADPGGICVSRVVRDQVRDKLDFVFEDEGEQQVKNIARSVRVYRIPITKEVAAPAPMALPEKPSLAVLPFANMTGDAGQDYFVDGIVEEITTAIARLPWLFVIARNSSFTYKGRSVDVKQVARELGVRYVLEGSVRKAGTRVRITGQLIDTASSAHIWADRFDGALDDIFELQDQIAGSVVGAIEPKLRLAEIERAARKPTTSLDAYDLYLRALAEFHKLTPETYSAAARLLQQALEIDPSYLPAAGLIGWCRVRQRTGGVVTQEEIADAVRLARHCIGSSKEEPDALWMAGFTIALLAGEHATGLNAIERALALNPNCALAWMVCGWVQPLLNRADLAVASFERAMRLSPIDPLGYLSKAGLALAHACAGRYREAMDWVDQSLRDQPGWTASLYLKVALCGLLDRTDEGQQWVARLIELIPDPTIARLESAVASFMPAQIRVGLTAGLRKSGVPET